MKAKLLFLIFILAAVMWMLVVIMVGTQNHFTYEPLLLSCPWAGIALGTIGGFCIGALGLRVYANASHKEYMRKLNERVPLQVQSGNDPLVSCQVGHRVPYIDVKTARGL